MIDENKEQLRNLFRTYNVVDVQPAVGDKLPDDISTLQVCEAGTFKHRTQMYYVAVILRFISILFSFTVGHHYPGCAAVPGWILVCHDELALSQSVRMLHSSMQKAFFSILVVLCALAHL